MKKILLAIVCLLSLMHVASGNVNLLDVSVKVDKLAYLSHEGVQAQVLIKNNSAQDLRLTHKAGLDWLEFDINRNGAHKVLKAKKMSFSASVIPAGKTVARNVNLSSLYPLVTQGNYTLRARINPNIEGWGSIISGPTYFDVLGGAEMFKKQQGIPGSGGKIVEFRIKVLNKVNGSELYFQSYDVKKKVILSTYSLGGYTIVNKPRFILDQSGHLNALYQIDAKIFRYLKIAHNGMLAEQTLHKVSSSGIPKLVENPNTKAVMVWNSVKYDIKEKREKMRAIHNISQRPPFAY